MSETLEEVCLTYTFRKYNKEGLWRYIFGIRIAYLCVCHPATRLDLVGI